MEQSSSYEIYNSTCEPMGLSAWGGRIEVTRLEGGAYFTLKQFFLVSFSHFSFLLQHSYQLMTHCWADNPDARPTFTELCQDLEDWMQRDTPYLDVDLVDEDQPYYDASTISASSGSFCEE